MAAFNVTRLWTSQLEFETIRDPEEALCSTESQQE